MFSSTRRYKDNGKAQTPKRLHSLRRCGDAHMRTISKSLHGNKHNWSTVFERLKNYINEKKTAEAKFTALMAEWTWYASDDMIITQRTGVNYGFGQPRDGYPVFFITPKTVFAQPSYPIFLPSLDGKGLDRLYKTFEVGDTIRIWGTKQKKAEVPSLSRMLLNWRGAVSDTASATIQHIMGQYDHILCEIQSMKTGTSYTIGFGAGVYSTNSGMSSTISGGVKSPDYLFNKAVLREYSTGDVGDYVELFAFGRLTEEHIEKLNEYFDPIKADDIHWRVDELYVSNEAQYRKKKNVQPGKTIFDTYDTNKKIENQRQTQIQLAKEVLHHEVQKEHNTTEETLYENIWEWGPLQEESVKPEYLWAGLGDAIKKFEKSNVITDAKGTLSEAVMNPWTRHSVGIGCIIDVDTKYCTISRRKKTTMTGNVSYNCASWASALFSDLISCGGVWTVAKPDDCHGIGMTDCTKTGNPIPIHPQTRSQKSKT